MDKREIRQQRVKGYFIEAACDIIRESGVRGLNIRKVADLAGYHYSTIYKYFKDFPHLIANAAVQLLEEASEYIEEKSNSKDPVEYYIDSWAAFCRFSLSNLNIFNCIFIEGYGDIEIDEVEEMFGKSSLFKSRRESIKRISEVMGISSEQAVKLDSTVTALCIGSIVLFVNGRSNFSEQELIQNDTDSIRLLIDSCKGV